MVENRLLNPARIAELQCLLVLLFLAATSSLHAVDSTESLEGLTPEISISPIREVDCIAEERAEPPALTEIFEAMRTGPGRAVACAALLDETSPGWQRTDGAQSLVSPFVAYLLGDGSARGMQRHLIFIELLGHLEEIAPDWRLRPSVHAMMPEIILGSVVEDPFVADFWRTALDEMDFDWQQSVAAESVLPSLYALAVTEQNKPLSGRNVRPRELLRDLSWPEYARLLWETEIFSSWPRRLLWIVIVLALLAFATRRLWRR